MKQFSSTDVLLDVAILCVLGYIAYELMKVPWDKVKQVPWDQIAQAGPTIARLNQIANAL